jgi:hypothetical protein
MNHHSQVRCSLFVVRVVLQHLPEIQKKKITFFIELKSLLYIHLFFLHFFFFYVVTDVLKTSATINPNNPIASAKINTKMKPTYTLGCLPTALTP